jgi:hypothetical protein
MSSHMPLREDAMASAVSMGAASSVASELEMVAVQVSPSAFDPDDSTADPQQVSCLLHSGDNITLCFGMLIFNMACVACSSCRSQAKPLEHLYHCEYSSCTSSALQYLLTSIKATAV